MVISHGEIWWASLPEKKGSTPAGRRPVLVVQSDHLNHSPLNTTVIATLTSNVKLGQAPGNLYLRAKQTGLDRDSVINVTQLFTLDKSELDEFVCTLPQQLMAKIEDGI